MNIKPQTRESYLLTDSSVPILSPTFPARMGDISLCPCPPPAHPERRELTERCL